MRAIADAAWEEAIGKSTTLRLKHGLQVLNLEDVTYEQAEKDAAFARSLVERIDAVARDGLSHDDELTLDILRWQAVATVEGIRHYWLPFVVTPYSGGLSSDCTRRST